MVAGGSLVDECEIQLAVLWRLVADPLQPDSLTIAASPDIVIITVLVVPIVAVQVLVKLSE